MLQDTSTIFESFYEDWDRKLEKNWYGVSKKQRIIEKESNNYTLVAIKQLYVYIFSAYSIIYVINSFYYSYFSYIFILLT